MSGQRERIDPKKHGEKEQKIKTAKRKKARDTTYSNKKKDKTQL